MKEQFDPLTVEEAAQVILAALRGSGPMTEEKAMPFLDWAVEQKLAGVVFQQIVAGRIWLQRRDGEMYLMNARPADAVE